MYFQSCPFLPGFGRQVEIVPGKIMDNFYFGSQRFAFFSLGPLATTLSEWRL